METLSAATGSLTTPAPDSARLRVQALKTRAGLAHLRRPAPVAEFAVSPEASPDPLRLQKLLERDWRAARAWEGGGADGEEMTGPRRDLALAMAAGRAGWNDQDIAGLLVAAGRRHGETRAQGDAHAPIKKALEAAHVRLAEEKGLAEVSRQFAGVFLGQFLSAMRATVQTNDIGHGGSAEQTFQAMFDAELADETARGDSFGLADLIYQGLMRARGEDVQGLCGPKIAPRQPARPGGYQPAAATGASVDARG